MARRSYKKPYRAKRKKPLLAKASFWRSLGGLVFVGGAVWVVCFCPALEVREVNVDGAQKISGQDCVDLIEAEITKKITFFDSKSILLFNLDQAKKEILAKYPQIQDIKIERKFPSKIYASVEERRGVAEYVDSRGGHYSVDTEGFAFEEAPNAAGVVEIIDHGNQGVQVGTQAIAKETLSAILKMKGEIDGAGKMTVVQVQIATPERINLLTSEGWYIYFNPLKDINDQMVKLNAVLADESFGAKRVNLEYLDIRFTRVYLKQKSIAGEEISETEVISTPQGGVQGAQDPAGNGADH
jgi:cell division septal protein FtsQ